MECNPYLIIAWQQCTFVGNCVCVTKRWGAQMLACWVRRLWLAIALDGTVLPSASLWIHSFPLAFLSLLFCRGHRYQWWLPVHWFIPDRLQSRRGGVHLPGHLASAGRKGPVQCLGKGGRKLLGGHWILRQYDDGERMGGRRGHERGQKQDKANWAAGQGTQ